MYTFIFIVYVLKYIFILENKDYLQKNTNIKNINNFFLYDKSNNKYH